MKRWPAAFAMMSLGCSAYGFADRPGVGVTKELVPVRTVDVDASSGADAGYLTRELVAHLQRNGLAGASWTTSQTRGAVACDVAVREEAFGEHVRVVAAARCAVDGEIVATRSGDAQLALAATTRMTDRAQAAEIAANRALEAAATEIAAHLTTEEARP